MPRRLVRATALLFAAAAVACSDNGTPTGIKGSGTRSSDQAPATLDGEVQALLSTVFSQGLQTAALARWDDVKRQLAQTQHETVKGTTQPARAARNQLVQLVSWLQDKTPNMTPPVGETQAHVAAHIALDMSLYVYAGPLAPVPVVTAASDVALGIVTPTAPATIQTPTQHAGTSFPAGAVDEPTVVVVAQASTKYPDNCSGPLDTHLCQYPQFYRFNVFPDVRLNQPATVGVCHVNSGNTRAPRPGIHDRFRLAHGKPADPAEYVNGGTIVDNIEILPLVFQPTLIDCTQSDSYSVSDASGSRTRNLWQRLASAIGDIIAPKNAYAIDQGGGGLVVSFSDFNVVDPVGKPDLSAGPGFALGSTQYFPGDTVAVSGWTISNGGDATAGAFTSQLVVASDSALTTGVVPLASPITTPSLIMGSTADMGPQTGVLPSSLTPGTYYVGAIVDNGSAIDETNKANNVVSVRVTVDILQAQLQFINSQPHPACHDAGPFGLTYNSCKGSTPRIPTYIRTQILGTTPNGFGADLFTFSIDAFDAPGGPATGCCGGGQTLQYLDPANPAPWGQDYSSWNTVVGILAPGAAGAGVGDVTWLPTQHIWSTCGVFGLDHCYSEQGQASSPWLSFFDWSGTAHRATIVAFKGGYWFRVL